MVKASGFEVDFHDNRREPNADDQVIKWAIKRLEVQFDDNGLDYAERLCMRIMAMDDIKTIRRFCSAAIRRDNSTTKKHHQLCNLAFHPGSGMKCTCDVGENDD